MKPKPFDPVKFSPDQIRKALKIVDEKIMALVETRIYLRSELKKVKKIVK